MKKTVTVSYSLDPVIVDRVKANAEALCLPVSRIAEIALKIGLDVWEGKVMLELEGVNNGTENQ